MIDTHTHLYDEQFKEDLDTILQKAITAGVDRFYLPNCDVETIPQMMDVAHRYPNHCFPMMGLHPCYVKENFEDELAKMKAYFDQHKFAAIGEIGLDYHWDKTFVTAQKQAFSTQIDWALALDLPIVIHSRSSTQDCIDIVRAKQNGKLKGVFHCFGDDLATAQQIIDLGFYVGIGGVVTFKNSILQEVIPHIDLQHIILETDAPYLAPVPYRGKRNDSSYIPLIALKIAALKNCSIDEVDKVTSQNAIDLYKL